jgi:hypothetical protein
MTWADSTHANYGTISRGNRAAAAVTAGVIDNGVVISYYRDATSGVTQLPYTYGAGANIRQVNSLLNVGTITYFAANLSSGTATGMMPAGEFRYVVVPGSISGGRFMSGAAMGYTPEQLKGMSYDQIRALFSIPE